MIEILVGCMFSGKTKALRDKYLTQLHVERISNQKETRTILIKFKGDQRYSKQEDVVLTHNKDETKGAHVCELLKELDPYVQQKNIEHIFIDEGQFFGDLSEYVLKWAFQGKKITIAALDAYANQQLWPEIAKLLPYSTYIKVNAICDSCAKKNATLSVKIKNQNSNQIEIGGHDKYKVLCVTCFAKNPN